MSFIFFSSFLYATYIRFSHSLLGLSPTLHQIGFGLLVTASTGRVLYLLHLSSRLPAKSPARKGGVRLFESGVASFLLGFAVWNVDK